jgi:hypothetical protein
MEALGGKWIKPNINSKHLFVYLSFTELVKVKTIFPAWLLVKIMNHNYLINYESAAEKVNKRVHRS